MEARLKKGDLGINPLEWQQIMSLLLKILYGKRVKKIKKVLLTFSGEQNPYPEKIDKKKCAYSSNASSKGAEEDVKASVRT